MTMKSNKEQVFSKALEQRYDEKEHSLKLNQLSKHWSGVLQYRDWTKVKRLELSQCGISDDNIKTLLKFDWPYLVSLSLYGNKLTAQGIRQLTKKQWPKLQSLSLNCNNIQNEGLLILLKKNLNQLTYLGLGKCGITQKGIQQMMNSTFNNLKQLNLQYNVIGNSGVKLLVKTFLPKLQKLYICYCKIESEGFKHLTKGKWQNLSYLSFGFYSNQLLNIVQLNGWNTIHHNMFKKLKQFYLSDFDAICWMNLVLVETSDAKILGYGIKISNEELKKDIMRILPQRNLRIIQN